MSEHIQYLQTVRMMRNGEFCNFYERWISNDMRLTYLQNRWVCLKMGYTPIPPTGHLNRDLFNHILEAFPQFFRQTHIFIQDDLAVPVAGCWQPRCCSLHKSAGFRYCKKVEIIIYPTISQHRWHFGGEHTHIYIYTYIYTYIYIHNWYIYIYTLDICIVI